MAEHREKSNNLIKADKGWEEFKSSWPNKVEEENKEEIETQQSVDGEETKGEISEESNNK